MYNSYRHMPCLDGLKSRHLPLKLLIVLYVTSVATEGTLLDPSFSLAINGVAAAQLFTYQQDLLPGQLPWAIQDEWVQSVYGAAPSMVYNVAVISSLQPDKEGVTVAVPVTTSDVREPLEWLQWISSQGFEGSTLLSHNSRNAPGSGRVQHLVCLSEGHEGGQLQARIVSAQQQAQCPPTTTLSPLAVHLYPAGSPSVGSTAAADTITPSQLMTNGASVADGTAAAASKPGNDVLQEEELSAPQVVDTCRYRNYLMYFGMSIPGGGSVSKEDFEAFLKQEVHPKLQGFTMYAATGFWAGEREATIVLEVTSAGHSIAADVGAIAAAYKRAFKQDAVLVKQNSCPAIAFV